jgi:hypothetical protein
VASAASAGLSPRQSPGAARAREHDEPDQKGPLLRRTSPDRDRSNRRRGAVLDQLAKPAVAISARGRDARTSRVVRVCR